MPRRCGRWCWRWRRRPWRWQTNRKTQPAGPRPRKTTPTAARTAACGFADSRPTADGGCHIGIGSLLGQGGGGRQGGLCGRVGRQGRRRPAEAGPTDRPDGPRAAGRLGDGLPDLAGRGTDASPPPSRRPSARSPPPTSPSTICSNRPRRSRCWRRRPSGSAPTASARSPASSSASGATTTPPRATAPRPARRTSRPSRAAASPGRWSRARPCAAPMPARPRSSSSRRSLAGRPRSFRRGSAISPRRRSRAI